MNNKTRVNYLIKRKQTICYVAAAPRVREPTAFLLSLFILDLIVNCLLACGGGIKEEGEGGEIAAHKTL